MPARDEDHERAVRRERHLRRLGSRTPSCACGEREPAALVRTEAGEIRCYECRADERGRPTIEQHHPAGRANDPATVPLPGNAHRLVSDYQATWPQGTLRNQSASPLRRSAAWLRGCHDLLRMICSRLGMIAAQLEDLDEHLSQRDRRDWWGELDETDEEPEA